MKKETNHGVTRRSFIKRSTVAAIAASNLTILSGIVNAYDESPSPATKKKCEVQKKEEVKFWTSPGTPNVKVRAEVWECWATGCSEVIQCGQYVKLDANDVAILDENGLPQVTDVEVRCNNTDDGKRVYCIRADNEV